MSSNTVTLAGTITVGPQGICEGGFPAGLLQLPFGLGSGLGSCGGSKPAARKFWSHSEVASQNAYVALDGVGTGESVTRANTLYLRTTAAVLLRLTLADPAGGPDIVSVVPMQGLWIQEFGNQGYLKLLEVQGTAGIEYFVSGDQ